MRDGLQMRILVFMFYSLRQRVCCRIVIRPRVLLSSWQCCDCFLLSDACHEPATLVGWLLLNFLLAGLSCIWDPTKWSQILLPATKGNFTLPLFSSIKTTAFMQSGATCSLLEQLLCWVIRAASAPTPPIWASTSISHIQHTSFKLVIPPPIIKHENKVRESV